VPVGVSKAVRFSHENLMPGQVKMFACPHKGVAAQFVNIEASGF
jgi:hypothetical protein